MNSKSKNRIIFLIFLIMLSIAFLDFSGLTNFAEPGTAILFGVGTVYLTILFSFSQSKTERKILDASYSFRWIVKFNLLLVIVTYVLLVVLSLGFAIVAGGEAGMGVVLTIIHGLYIAPLLILFLSFLPLIIYHRFYSNQKIFILIFSLVIIVLAAFNFAKFTTCSFGYDYHCLSNKNAGIQDSGACDKSMDELTRDYCYAELAKKKMDVQLCNRITKDKIVKYYCVLDIVAITRDTKSCENIDFNNNHPDFEKTSKEECYSSINFQSKP